MRGWIFLNSKEVKDLVLRLKEQFDFTIDLDYVFLKNEKNKVFIVNRDVANIDFSKLRLNSMGLYFAEDKGGNNIRLSIEGSQIIGPSAKKNIVDVDSKQQREWLKGIDLELDGASDGFVIVRYKDDYMGCAKHKDGKLLNHIPKERRIRASD